MFFRPPNPSLDLGAHFASEELPTPKHRPKAVLSPWANTNKWQGRRALLAIFPLISLLLPKIEALPASVTQVTESGPNWAGLLTIIWASGFVICIARLALAAFGLSRWRKRVELLDRIEGVAIYQLEGLQGPVAAGIFKPVIFVPENWQNLPTSNREIIIAHELAHHHRRDPPWRLCVEIAKAIHWYHPCVHWMAKRFTLQSECACDELVLRNGFTPKSYAGVLCDFAQARSASPLALAMAEASSLEIRVKRIASPARKGASLPIIALACFGVMAASALSMLKPKPPTYNPTEIDLRLSADPFPGEP